MIGAEMDKNAAASLQVIGAGFPRTGTLSFSKALEILLDGPVCHSGTDCLDSEQEVIKKWTSILKAHPETDKEYIRDTLKTIVGGYVGIADVPGALFVSELLEIYPNAIVICTMRDTETWFRSCSAIAKDARKMAFLLPLFWPLPSIRWFRVWVEAILIRAQYNYSSPVGRNLDNDILSKDDLATHVAYVTRVTPRDRLFFFNVQDGWGPLCKILGRPIPDEKFPELNSAKEHRKFLLGFLKKALWKWLEIIIVLCFVLGLLSYVFR